ncbi:MAG TPA: hypothetical protein VFT49_03075 [Candidatus Saccharimonadales bacterium]|nr:hypothetical protein [Candidatus Saccharimonadales bacterium]
MSYQERLRPQAFNMQDALRGQLPTVDVIEQNFADLASRSANPQQRAEMLIRATQRYGLDSLSIDPMSETYGSDVVSSLFIDAVALLAYSQLADLAIPSEESKFKGRRKSRFIGHVLKKIESKKNFLQHLQDYVGAFEGAGDPLLLEGLRTVMYEAKCLLEDDLDITYSRINQTNGELIGMLAEHKILMALRASGWELATYASAEEDLAQTDIKLPFVTNRRLESLAVQVKAKKGADPGLDIVHTPDGFIVRVPMSRSSLNLPSDEAGQLEQAVLAKLDILAGVAL